MNRSPPVTNKKQRLEEFIRRLSIAVPCRDHNSAFGLVNQTLTEVEDELSTIPNNPNTWKDDGRMYPPQPDSERASTLPGVRRYRSVRHNTEIGKNGSIRISEVMGEGALIDKAGFDGKKVTEL